VVWLKAEHLIALDYDRQDTAQTLGFRCCFAPASFNYNLAPDAVEQVALADMGSVSTRRPTGILFNMAWSTGREVAFHDGGFEVAQLSEPFQIEGISFVASFASGAEDTLIFSSSEGPTLKMRWDGNMMLGPKHENKFLAVQAVRGNEVATLSFDEQVLSPFGEDGAQGNPFFNFSLDSVRPLPAGENRLKEVFEAGAI